MRRMRGCAGLVAAGWGLLVAAVLPGCSQEAIFGKETTGTDQWANPGEPTFQVVADNFRLSPAQLTVEAGQRFTVTLANHDTRPHSITFDLPGGPVSLDQPVEAGQSRVLLVTAPDKLGTYAFYCPIGSNRGLGLEGKLTVKERTDTRPPVHTPPSSVQPWPPQPGFPPPFPPPPPPPPPPGR